MSLFWTLAQSWASECPNEDLYAYRRDPYAVVLFDEVIRFQLIVESEQWIEPNVEAWQQMLLSCDAHRTQVYFVQWQESWTVLLRLGQQFQQQPSWRLMSRFRLGQQIRSQERQVAIGYAKMLRSLNLETGISVYWDPQYRLSKGMISTARGAKEVYRYIEVQYNVQL